MRFEAHPGVSAGVEQERGLLRGRVDVVVVGELCEWKERVPVVLSFPDKDAYVLFQFLVNPFGLSVSLRMIGGRRGGFDPEQSVEFLHEQGDELWPSIGDNLAREAVEFPDIADVEVSGSGGCDSGHRLDEVRPLTYGVDYRHDGVVPAGLWEFYDEIYTDDFPTFIRDRKQVKFSDREAALGLRLET